MGLGTIMLHAPRRANAVPVHKGGLVFPPDICLIIPCGNRFLQAPENDASRRWTERRSPAGAPAWGIARTKRDGRCKGRAPTARQQAAEIVRLNAKVSGPRIAGRLGIGRASVYRVLGVAAGC